VTGGLLVSCSFVISLNFVGALPPSPRGCFTYRRGRQTKSAPRSMIKQNLNNLSQPTTSGNSNHLCPTILTTKCPLPTMTPPPLWQLLQRLLPAIPPRTPQISSRSGNLRLTGADAVDAAVETKARVEVAAAGTRIWAATNTSKCVSPSCLSRPQLADLALQSASRRKHSETPKD